MQLLFAREPRVPLVLVAMPRVVPPPCMTPVTPKMYNLEPRKRKLQPDDPPTLSMMYKYGGFAFCPWGILVLATFNKVRLSWWIGYLV